MILEANADMNTPNLNQNKTSKHAHHSSVGSKHLVANQILNTNRPGDQDNATALNSKTMQMQSYDQFTRNQTSNNMLGNINSLNK